MASSSNRLRALRLVLQIVLGAVFVYSAWAKLRNPWQVFAMDIINYNILPLKLVEIVARTLPWAEGALGLALIIGVWPRVFAPVASAILLTFFVMMLRAFANGDKIACGCFGPGELISPLTLLRDGALVTAALALTWMSFRRRRAAV